MSGLYLKGTSLACQGGPHWICTVKRNQPGKLVQEIAASGGVIGMGYWANVACGDITPNRVAKMIEAAIETVGVDHAMSSTDYDGSVEITFDTLELVALTAASLEQDLTETQVRMVMGENFVRVFHQQLN